MATSCRLRAWEPEVLALRVKDYTAVWLDQLCFTGQDWLGPPDIAANRQRPPRDTGAIEPNLRLRAREPRPLAHAFRRAAPTRRSPRTRRSVFGSAQIAAAHCSSDEIVRRTALLPSRVEHALAELTALWTNHGRQLRRACARCLFRKKSENGSLLRTTQAQSGVPSRASNLPEGGLCCAPVRRTANAGHEESVEASCARASSADTASSFDGSSKESLQSISGSNFCGSTGGSKPGARFEGGYFVSGVSGEQFAHPGDRINAQYPKGSRIRRPSGVTRRLTAISGARSLNLAGILAPGPRIAASPRAPYSSQRWVADGSVEGRGK